MSTPPKTPGNESASARTSAARLEGELDKAAVSSSAEQASDDLSKLREDLSRLSSDVAALVSSQAGYAKETARDYANDLYGQGVTAMRGAEDQARQAIDDLGRKVQENPLGSIGIAFGVGYLLGFLKRGR